MPADKVKVRPTGDRVLIRRDEAESKTKGGIVLPDTAKQKPRRGTVQAVGPEVGYHRRGPDEGQSLPAEDRIEAGRVVIFNVYGQHDVPGCDGLVLVREEDILAVLE